MRKKTRRCKAEGGDVSAIQISKGQPSGMLKGNWKSTPSQSLSRGVFEGQRSGRTSKSLAMGMPGGRKMFSKGGHATENYFDPKGERLRKSIKRNEILGSPHYAKGGKVPGNMKTVYEKLHSRFDDSPPMKKLGAKKSELYEGEPHRYKKASGGRLWIQKAINPSKKGALHKALGVPVGQRIPMSKIKKAEHSKSPLLRKRANLAETLKKLHH